ncbi:polyprenyl synthetase family protein [Enterococcus hulanensis]|uniref:Polyprenyl synthetase family protein n=1 Tax=Enterococcus hulanensis TaxID=2559929 RepID=A0ABU3EXT3_9ENTE|nr:polyprenyl synthetase family protein [Enterococcus hulanensis]MDT2599683.1 polyprenyl synthetase family protein [Enterococcus hulanensis]MDT2609461.1 polyprenyl synthetase family protein [Enterococcus hulanensis]MDT2616038.1 polyprenyl synthetase family protein [Enterococcus hulanensis]MDT2627922.1 polyprenyl synthetase family protein [Enterococcus hulanensis]MDT2655027.1 polyprenyl synthetase family protein [Enterococcus hulanensis]
MLDYWNEYPKIQENLIQVKKLISQRLVINNKSIEEAITKFSSTGGKMIRPALFFLFADFGDKKEQEQLVKIAASLELLHSATLVHDDIIDDSPTRRGLPSVQSRFGKDVAVYTGDFMYTSYFELLAECMSHTPFLLKNAQAMKKVLQGELTQMTCTFDPDQTIGDYLRNINGKTAELIRLSCHEGAYFGGSDKKLQSRAKRIGSAIGLAFQIYDDILNFSLKLGNDQKPILTDVQQGIFTLPLLIARDNQPEVIRPYLEHPETLSRQELIQLAYYVDSFGGIAGALDFAEKLTKKALNEIQELPDGKSKEILKTVAVQLLERSY